VASKNQNWRGEAKKDKTKHTRHSILSLVDPAAEITSMIPMLLPRTNHATISHFQGRLKPRHLQGSIMPKC
jgi:hypothetical protein